MSPIFARGYSFVLLGVAEFGAEPLGDALAALILSQARPIFIARHVHESPIKFVGDIQRRFDQKDSRVHSVRGDRLFEDAHCACSTKSASASLKGRLLRIFTAGVRRRISV